MAIYDFTDKGAVKNFGRSKGVRWFKAGPINKPINTIGSYRRILNWLERFDKSKQEELPVLDEAAADLASNKIKYGRVFKPAINPTFKIDKDWNVFAIGSCFARGVERALLDGGFNVVSAATEFNGFERATEGVQQLGFTNKYTTHSILNEIKWALVPGESCPEDSVVDITSEESIDPHINPTLKFVKREETLKRRALISEVQGRITTCQLVVLTLGLVECWKDNQAGVFLNMTPTKAMLDKCPGRYSLHVIGYEENKANLDEVYQILMEYGHPDLHIIVTVSPVPLLATFTGRDVVVANSFSKSVLRTVAEEWAVTKENVNYFPSYEIVNNTHRDVAWENDLRHVKVEVVKSIMSQLVENYVD